MTPETAPSLVGLSPLELFDKGERMFDDYTVDNGVEDYLQLHPGADPVAVRAEIEASQIDPKYGAGPVSIAAILAERLKAGRPA